MAKKRWWGKSMWDAMVNQRAFKTEQYLQECFANGLIFLNEEVAKPKDMIQNGDVIQYRQHKHEPPVPDSIIEVTEIQEDLWMLNKPCGIPIHPCGSYKFNSATGILAVKTGEIFHPINRLDRLTSGAVLLSHSSKKSAELASLFREQKVNKLYLARVRGRFPSGKTSVNQPVLQINPTYGIHGIHPDGKPAHTDFNFIHFDGETSLVECIPRTGRAHQIRVHLAFLGHPIATDFNYGGLFIPRDHVLDRNDPVWKDMFLSCLEDGCFGCKQIKTWLNGGDLKPYSIGIWLHAWKYIFDGDTFEVFKTRMGFV